MYVLFNGINFAFLATFLFVSLVQHASKKKKKLSINFHLLPEHSVKKIMATFTLNLSLLYKHESTLYILA